MSSIQNPFAPGLLSRIATTRKIAVLRASRIGDFLCTIPALRALRATLPEAEIAMITLPMLRDLAHRSPYIDRYIAFPGYPGIAEQLFDARKAVQFFQKMQNEHFDLALQMQGSGVNSNPFMLLLGANTTAGFIRAGDPSGRLDAALPFPQEQHEIRRMLALSTFLGAPSHGEDLEFPLLHSDHARAALLLTKSRPPLIGLHSSARDATRRWPIERFIATGKELAARYGGTIVLLGEQQTEGEILARAMNLSDTPGVPTVACLNLMGQTSLPVLGAIIARLSVLITNDTGPAHIAYALPAPVVTIFGGGSPTLNGPLSDGPHRVLLHAVPCRPCGYATCPIGYSCLEQVTVQEVVEAAASLIRYT